MNVKARKIGIIMTSSALIVLIGVIVYNVVGISKLFGESTDSLSTSYISMDTKTLDICAPGVDCGYATRNYDIMKSSKKEPKLDSIIETINNKTNELYNTSLNSTDMSSLECASVSNQYQRSIMTQSLLTIYESDDLFAFALVGGESNLCLKTYTTSLDIAFYDAKNDKTLTEDEIKEKYSITEEEIQTAITNDITQRNIDEAANYETNITDYHIYIDNDGQVCVYYLQPEENVYYSVTLDKNIKD